MSLRTEMPITADFIDALRDAFGKEGIDASIRKGMAGVPGFFHASEAGRSVGTQDIERRGVSAAQMVIEQPKKDEDADRNRRR